MFDFEVAKKQITRHEGVSSTVYNDHLGFATIGVGRLVDARRGGGLSKEEINYLLENDLKRIHDTLPKAVPFYDRLEPAQQIGLVDMAFQLGVGGLLRFKKMLAALAVGDYATAWQEGEDSVWYKQTPARARFVLSQLTMRDMT